MIFEKNKAVASRFFEELDRCRAVPEELCAAGATFRPEGIPPMDLASFKQFVGVFFAAFPDLTHTIQDMVAEGDTVAA